MSGTLILIMAAAGFFIYVGRVLERARRAGQDARLVRRRVATLRATRSKEYLRAAVIVGGTLGVFLMFVRWG